MGKRFIPVFLDVGNWMTEFARPNHHLDNHRNKKFVIQCVLLICCRLVKIGRTSKLA